MTEEQARSTLLSFEGSTEGSHHGHPDFRVAGKIFATLWPGEARSVLRLPRERAEATAQSNPERHRVLSPSANWAWLDVRLELIDHDDFRDLATAARENVAHQQ